MNTQTTVFQNAENDVMGSTYKVELVHKDFNSRNTFYSKKLGHKENSNKVTLLLSMLKRLIYKNECFSEIKRDFQNEKNKLTDYIEVNRQVASGQYSLIMRIFSFDHKGEWIQILDPNMVKEKHLMFSIREILHSTKTGKSLDSGLKHQSIDKMMVFKKMTKVEFDKYFIDLEKRFGADNVELLKYKITYMQTFPESFFIGAKAEVIDPISMWEKVNTLFEQEIGPSEYNSNLRGKIKFHSFQKETNSILLYFISNEFAKIFREKYSENFKRILINVFGNIQIKTAIVK